MLKFIKLTRKQAVELSRKHNVKVLEAALSIPSHEAQKWREAVAGKLRLSPYFCCDRASSVRASKRLEMEYTFVCIENGGSMLLRKVCTYLTNFVTIRPRRITGTTRSSFWYIYLLFYLTTPSTAVVI